MDSAFGFFRRKKDDAFFLLLPSLEDAFFYSLSLSFVLRALLKCGKWNDVFV